LTALGYSSVEAASAGQPTTKVGTSGRRLQAFDAARGIAVLFMCLSHFVGVYFRNPTHVQRVVMSVCMVASPTFIILSGVMLGFLSDAGDDSFRRLRFKLTDRAVFLLTITHVLLTIAMWPTDRAASHGWGRSSITDAVAIAILFALWTPRRRRLRVVLGVVGLALSWFVVLHWHPTNTVDVGLKELLFGAPSFQLFSYSWPVIPWASAYIVCTVLGDMMGRRRHEPARMVRLGFVAAASSFAGAAGWALLGRRLAVGQHLAPMFSPWTKFPPSPEYFLLFGGCALVLISTVLWCAHRHWFELLNREAARLGRCSLMLFVAQAFVYYFTLTLFPLPSTSLWPLLFVVTLIPLYVVAYFWDRRKLNAMLSVGLEGWLTRLQDNRTATLEESASS
jgi:uncharacterized membrane protein